MKIVNKISEMQKIVDSHRINNEKIAVVPTMGYLHDGHLSLIETAKKYADIIITTLFVNPTQFAPNEDFEKYPRDFDKDAKLANNAGSDYLFTPNTLDMYPKGFNSSIHIGTVTDYFEGEKRPTHFDGVATVVAKLFNITKPDFAIFGQKDYQQTLVIKKLVNDFDFDIEIIVSPTIRESNGLAMSSRNSYLSDENRKKAGIIFVAIEEAKHAIEKGETSRKIINAILHKTLRQVPEIQIDYAMSADADNLSSPEIFLPGDKVVILIACYLGKTRLIDNAVVKIPGQLTEENFS
jgi:pantoate--beta-alanine ligase